MYLIHNLRSLRNQPPPEVIEEYQKHTQAAASAPKQKASSKQRQGGCGAYSVVQCGKAGHNVRSKPGMKGAPVGRLLKGNKIEASEEVRLTCCLQSVLVANLPLIPVI